MHPHFHHHEDGLFYFNFHGLFHRWISAPCALRILPPLLVLSVGLSAAAEPVVLRTPRANDFQWTERLSEEQTFWQRPRPMESIQQTWDVLVSSHVKSPDHWSFQGAGWVKAPADQCLDHSRQLEILSQWKDRFPKAQWNSLQSQLAVEIQFLGQVREMTLEVFEIRTGHRFFFRSLGPWMKGLEGVVKCEDVERQAQLKSPVPTSQVSLAAVFQGHIRWVPDFIFKMASEAIMHHVALSLRNQMENDYKLQTAKTTAH